MKLLLTSAGITNKSIESVLKKWLKNVKEIKIAFIPTAANIESGDKDWLIQNYVECQKLGQVDIVDISALEKKNWLSRLQNANIIVVGGGNTTHLMKCIKSSGLEKELSKLLKDKIYVGISAGSMVMSKVLNTPNEHIYYDEPLKASPGLGYVNFNIRPHLNSKYFKLAKNSNFKKIAKKLYSDMYALDDKSAIAFDNGKISIVSEGKYIIYKKKT